MPLASVVLHLPQPDAVLGDRWPRRSRSTPIRLQRDTFPRHLFIRPLRRLPQSFGDAINLQRYVVRLDDYGSQSGFCLAFAKPKRMIAVIIRLGDTYADMFEAKTTS
jgi:hypothetical protein